jgi:hypothetical protein
MAKKKDIPVVKRTVKDNKGVIGNKGNSNPPYQFPQGNQFWLRRGKHGRDRIVQDPKALIDTANEYFQYCVENPIQVIDFKGSQVQEVDFRRPQVFEKSGLLVFLGVNKWETITNLRTVSKDFSDAVDYIENVIFYQKYSNAVVGMYNATLIARDLKLADVTESTVKVEGTIDATKLTDEQLEAIRNAR